MREGVYTFDISLYQDYNAKFMHQIDVETFFALCIDIEEAIFIVFKRGNVAYVAKDKIGLFEKQYVTWIEVDTFMQNELKA